ncbi:MAG: hypothetical protein K1X72_01445 [Pyrinomonadaceae bacterium]|nr:hypothetical protein [Pyrinomonadaceae bacterium]
MKAKSLIYLIILLLVLSTSSFAQKNYTGEPVTKNGLNKALKLKQFQTSDIVQIINEQGVDFKLTSDIESELKLNGARPELIDAVRRNFRGSLKVSLPNNSNSNNPPKTSNPPPNTTNTSNSTNSNSNTYSGLVTQAINLYENANSTNRSIEILEKAVSLEPNKYPAYQMLGHITLYGKKDFKKAEQYMKKAIDIGGSAVFRVKHAHDYNFFTSCEGSLYISKNMVHFESDHNEDTFHVRHSEIVKIETQGKWSGIFTLKVKGGIFHLIIRDSKGKEEDKYQFSPLTGKDEERKMIIRFIDK